MDSEKCRHVLSVFDIIGGPDLNYGLQQIQKYTHKSK